MAGSVDRILTTHVGSLVRPPAAGRIPAQDRGSASPTTRPPTRPASSNRSTRSSASRSRPASTSSATASSARAATGPSTSTTASPAACSTRALNARGGQGPAWRRRAADRTAPPSPNSTPNTTGPRAWASGSARASSSTGRSSTRDVQVKRDIANLKAAAAKAKAHGAFLPVVAPASALPGAKNEHYPDEQTLLFALADCLHQEYQAIVDAGLYVQIDDAFLPYMHEKMVPPMTRGPVPRLGADAHRRAQPRAQAASRRSARAITSAGAAGTGRTPSTCRMKDIVDLMLQVNVGAYQFEAANPRHEHEWVVWQIGQAAARQDAHSRASSATPPTSSSIRSWWRSASCGSPRSSGART